MNHHPDGWQWFDRWLLFFPHPCPHRLFHCFMIHFSKHVKDLNIRFSPAPPKLHCYLWAFSYAYKIALLNPVITWKRERALSPPEGCAAWVHHRIFYLQFLHQLDFILWRSAWVKLYPPRKRYVVVLTPSTCKCDLLWKQGLCRCNQGEMRSWYCRCALDQCDWCPCKGRRNTHQDRHSGPKAAWWQREREMKCHSYKARIPRLTRS